MTVTAAVTERKVFMWSPVYLHILTFRLSSPVSLSADDRHTVELEASHVTQRGTQTGEEDRRRVKRHWTKSDNVREEDEDGDKTATSEGGRRAKDEDQRTETQSGTKTSSPEGCRLLKRPDKLFSRWMKFGIQRVKHSVCWEDGFQLKGFARDILSIC